MTAHDLQRDVGRLEATVKAQGDQLRMQRKQLTAMDAKLDRIVMHVERERGSKRALVAVGSALGSAVGMAAGLFVSWFKG